jgi:hypothetical protein
MLIGSGGYLWGLIPLIMIETKELRIGNKIYPLKDCDEVVDVTDLDGDSGRIGTTAFFYNNKGTCDTRSDVACGIPLTPEWLERCGFTTDGNGDDNHPMALWEHPKTRYKYSDGSLVHNGASSDDWHDVGNVDYLHQLQNLFYWVTGEELEIKLP